MMSSISLLCLLTVDVWEIKFSLRYSCRNKKKTLSSFSWRDVFGLESTDCIKKRMQRDSPVVGQTPPKSFCKASVLWQAIKKRRGEGLTCFLASSSNTTNSLIQLLCLNVASGSCTRAMTSVNKFNSGPTCRVLTESSVLWRRHQTRPDQTGILTASYLQTRSESTSRTITDLPHGALYFSAFFHFTEGVCVY